MPTVLRVVPYRFFFYAGDAGEPEHIHVERDDCVVKFWLLPVRLSRSLGFGRSEIVPIQSLVEENQSRLLGASHGYFDR